MSKNISAQPGNRQENVASLIRKYISENDEPDRIPVTDALFYLLGENAEGRIPEMTDALNQLAGFICRPDINVLFASFIKGSYAETAGQTLIQLSQCLTNLNNGLALAQISLAQYDSFRVAENHMDWDEETYTEKLQIAELRKSLLQNRKKA